MRAIVTGGAGFIGSHLCERLAAEGHTVLAVDNFAAGRGRVRNLAEAGVEIDETDIRDPSIESVVLSFGPDAIFHLAAQMIPVRSVADPVYDAEVNIVGTLRLLEAARRAGARFVNTSSGGAMYGELDEGASAFTEETVGRPDSPYGVSKKVGEDYLRVYARIFGLSFVSLALGNVYGPRQDPEGEAGVVAIFAGRLLRGEPCVIYGDGKQTRDFVYVDDVISAYLKALEGGEGETFNIGTGEETSVEELYRAMAAIVGTEAPPRYEPERPGEVRRVTLDPTKAGRLLDWKPEVPLAEGLRRTIESFA